MDILRQNQKRWLELVSQEDEANAAAEATAKLQDSVASDAVELSEVRLLPVVFLSPSATIPINKTWIFSVFFSFSFFSPNASSFEFKNVYARSYLILHL